VEGLVSRDAVGVFSDDSSNEHNGDGFSDESACEWVHEQCVSELYRSTYWYSMFTRSTPVLKRAGTRTNRNWRP